MSVVARRSRTASVVVATWRRPDLMERCLAALCAQGFDRARYEIVVADDDAGGASAPAVRALVDATALAHPLGPLVRYVPVTRTQGPAGARNAGWRLSAADVVAFTDDDTIPDAGWLAAGVAALAEWDAVGGAIRMPLPTPPTDYEVDAAGLSRAEFATANCFVRRDALLAIGGFDERFTSAWREDSDLHFALLASGFRVGHASAAVVLHPVRPAPFGVSLSQQKKVVFDALLYKKHPVLYRERILRRPPWAYYASGAALVVAFVAAVSGLASVAAVAAGAWLALTLRFAWRRLSGTSHRPRHVAEMLWTSIAIPPLALWWRLVGAVRYRVAFL